jgi:molybdopterin converting factor subunit 1
VSAAQRPSPRPSPLNGERERIAVRARLFARLREQAGTDDENLELPAGSTVSDVYDALTKSHPGLEANRNAVRAALNQEFADWDSAVTDGDEVAFIPPVSGGAHGTGVLFELTSRPLDARRMETAVAHKGAGAICTFTGVVRDHSRGRSVTHLEYEAYAEMATAKMRDIAGEIGERWPEARVAMAHRTGRLEVGEPSVVVSVSSPHRAEAIAACKWGIDRLKETVPIWKKEHADDGTYWIEGDEAKASP